MGNRLSRIYTRTGDDGSTGLADGSRVSKASARIEACGCVDELNAVIGLTLVAGMPAPVRKILRRIQHELFVLGGELATRGATTIQAEMVTRLEVDLDGFNVALPPLKEFILPGGGQAAATCHVARTVVRRTERRLCVLAAEEAINPESLRYLNRLADLLFVLSRVLTQAGAEEETLWNNVNRRRGNQPTGQDAP